jgi:tetratricopeptide (TPR) repeat protein
MAMGLNGKIFVGLIALFVGIAPTFAGSPPSVEACLKVDDFRDGSNAVTLCMAAEQEPRLDDHTKALVLKKHGDALYWAARVVEAGLLYNKALELDPKNVDIRLMKARVLRRTNNLEASYKATMEVLSDEPENPTALYDAGLVWAAAGENDKALAFYEATLKVDPKHVLARVGVADYYQYTAGQPDRVLKEYEAILELGKDALNQTKSIGSSRLESKDFYLWVASQRVGLLSDANRPEDATKALEPLIAEYPNEPYLRVQHSKILIIERHFDDAVTEAQQANKECLAKFDNSLCDEGLLTEVQALSAAGKHEQSVSAGQRIVAGAYDPYTKSEAFYYLGFSKQRLGKNKEAADDFLKSVDAYPPQSQVLLTALSQNGYYEGENTDPMSDRVKTALEACMIDPECL